MLPSKNLIWQELACKDGTNYPNEFRVNGSLKKLTEMFENIRAIWNKPIKVISAYRTPAHNLKIGGVKNSQHVQGRALDLQPPDGITINEFYRHIFIRAHTLGIGGLGRYKTFVHVDIRPVTRLVVWDGTGKDI